MKLASYKDGSRDGHLVVVSRDLKTAHYATGAATRLQHLLDDWGFVSPQLQDLYDALNQGRLRHAFAFDPAACEAPLPRACAWCRADLNGVPAFGPADHFASPRHEMRLPAEGQAVVARLGLAAYMGDVPAYAGPGQCIDGVRLLALACDLADASPHASADSPALTGSPGTWRPVFGPVAVTPDELGDQWRGGRVRVPIAVSLNGARPQPLAVDDDTCGPGFGEFASLLVRQSRLAGGSIIASLAIGGEGAPTLTSGDRLQASLGGPQGDAMLGSIDLALHRREVAST